MKKLILILVFLVLASCRSPQRVQTEVRDSVRTEYRTVLVPDTAWVEIPAQEAKSVTRDSVSRLETDYAESTAEVRNGLLLHELKNKNVPVKVKYQKQVEFRDSIAYKYRDAERTVEVNRLTGFQKFQIYGFWTLLILTLISVLIKLK